MLLIKNGYIKSMAGPDLPRGCVLIGDDGKILSVAEQIDAPEATIIDAEGRLVTPGCVDAHCHIGLDNQAMGWEGRDYNEAVDPITPQMRAIDSINPLDEAFPLALKGGVTSACTGPGSANVVGGTFVAIKLAGKRVDKMIIKDPIAMKCAFGENPKRCYQSKGDSARMTTAAKLREMLFNAQDYLKRKEAAEDDSKLPKFDMKMEALIPVLKGEIPLKAHAHRADDICTAIRIAKEFDVRITLDHCTDGSLIAQELAKEGYPALVGPSFGKRGKEELQHKSFDTPAVLHKAGVKVCIVSDANVVPIEYLPLYAGLAASEGLPLEEAWRAITINPAEVMGIADRVGSLEPGKDGDLVIWTADPLTAVAAKAHTTIIDGKVAHQR